MPNQQDKDKVLELLNMKIRTESDPEKRALLLVKKRIRIANRIVHNEIPIPEQQILDTVTNPLNILEESGSLSFALA